MKKTLLFMHMLLFLAVHSYAQTPLSMNGRLKVEGTKILNECGNEVQLRGLSTHGTMFHGECYTEEAVRAIAQDWKADLLRLALYTANSNGATKGYAQSTDKEFHHQWIDNMVNLTEKYGMYVMIDWHILSDNDPHIYIEEAKTFFTLMSQKYKDRKHVIYEICNEPNTNVGWPRIKTYAETIIPLIRANDPNAIIIVGTPNYSSDLGAVVPPNNRLSGNNAHNTMYALHFYAGSDAHNGYRDALRNAVSNGLPVFVSEWGTTNYDGDGTFNRNNSDTWLNLLSELKISWANWQFSDKNEASSLLEPNACREQNWTKFKGNQNGTGIYIYNKLREVKGYTACPNITIPTREKPPVCTNASGNNLNIYGCPITNGINTNYCLGYNSKQAYVRTDFSQDSVPYFDYWKKPSEGAPEYSATIENEKLVIKSINADPGYSTMGFDFGKIDTVTHIPIDLRANAKLEFDLTVNKDPSYPHNNIVIFFKLADSENKEIDADRLGNSARLIVPTDGITRRYAIDFTNGMKRIPATDGTPTSPKEDQFIRDDFNFAEVTKVLLNINPNVFNPNNPFHREPYTGTWTLDNFSLGYDESKAVSCEEWTYVEEDLCPDDPNKTKPGRCGCGVPEDGCDCAGVAGGKAYLDLCGQCVGGTTGKEECDGNAYLGRPHVIPGKIEAEHFDEGGQGVGYYDSTPRHENTANTFRTEERVEIEQIGNSDNYNIGYTEPGEWLNYTVDVQNTGTYFIKFRVASELTTGAWNLSLNGEKLAGTDLTCPNTGGWQTFQDVSAPTSVHLPKGKHVLRLNVVGGGFNIDYMEFTPDEIITSMAPKATNRISVYPMPASQKVTIEQSIHTYNRATIMDMTGNIIKIQGLSSAKEEVNLNNVAQGIYLIQLSGQEGSEFVRVVVQ